MIAFFPRRKRKKVKQLNFRVDVTVDDDDNVVVYLSQDNLKITGIKEKVSTNKSIGDIVEAYIFQYVKLPRRYKKTDGQ